MRVLLIAEAANPRWVSVPLVGWSHAQAIGKLVETHLVTQVRNREAILEAGLKEGTDFTAIDSEKLARPVWALASRLGGSKGKGWTMGTALNAVTYPYFERLLWQQFKAAIERKEFDVVHQLTPLSPTIGSQLAGKCRQAGVPFVWGPINGGVAWPTGFGDARRREWEWLSWVRDAHRLLPGYRIVRENAAAILIGSRDTWNEMPARYRPKCVYLPENAIEPERFTKRRTRQAGRPVRAIFVGRLVPYKGLEMVLEAGEELLRRGLLKLVVVGDGLMREEIEGWIDTHGVRQNVETTGWVEHEQVQDRMAEADVLAFPSIREFGGGVVLEAMAVGVVPIVVNYGGPGELVTKETGFAVPMGNRQEIVKNLRQVLEEIARCPQRIEKMSAAGIERVKKDFTWEAKARQVVKIYRAVAQESRR